MHQTDAKNNSISQGFCWLVWFMSRPPPQVEVNALLGTFSVTMQSGSIPVSVSGSFMIFLLILDILLKDSWCLCVSFPDLVMLCTQTYTQTLTHRHSELEDGHRLTQIHSHSFHAEWSRAFATQKHTHTQSVHIFSRGTHSCFTCLVVLVGHGMRRRECVSVEEKTWQRGRVGGWEREERGNTQFSSSHAHWLI